MDDSALMIYKAINKTQRIIANVSTLSIVLTALGIIVGLLLGCIMGSITVASIEPITGVFFKGVDAIAIFVGILGSALLAIIMSLIALRRINKFDLTDINRF